MKALQIRLVLNRDHHRRLVNGHAVFFSAPVGRIEVILDLNRPGEARWTDPPEAEEFYPKRTE